jgi:microcystin-dependent protein
MDPFLGEIRIFAGDYAPEGWMMCQGQVLPISGNNALFAIIGNIYGGDGVNNFALPDFRGRVPLGFSTIYPLYPLGQKDGIEMVELKEDNLPMHRHSAQVKCANRSDSETPGGNVPGAAIVSSSNAPRNEYVPSAGQTLVNLASSCVSIDPEVGGSVLHQNVQPSMALNFIISMEGIFPTRG